MKLTDLVEALANEVDIMQPQLVEVIGDLSDALSNQSNANQSNDLSNGVLSDNADKPNADETDINKLIDDYSDYVSRLGEASEMIDFIGIKKLCDRVLDNVLLLSLSTVNDDEVNQLLPFLTSWSDNLAKFLHQLTQDNLSQLLNTFTAIPVPLTEYEVDEIRQLLSEITEQVASGAVFKDNDEERVTEATLEDVDLELPEDIDQSLINGFLQESPDMANELVAWAKQVSQGADILLEDLQRAKRYTHTLKGTGATIGARGLASVGHHLEDLLEYLEDNPTHANDSIKGLLLDSAYCLDQMVGYIADTDDSPEEALSILQQLLDVNNKIYQGESLEDFELASQPAGLNGEPTQPNDTSTQNTSINNVSEQPNTSKQTTAPNTPNTPTATKEKTKTAKTKVATLRIPVKKVDDLFRISSEVSIHSSAMEDKIKQLSEQTQQLLEQNLHVQKRLFELETLVDVRALNLIRSSSSSSRDHGLSHGNKHLDDSLNDNPLLINQQNVIGKQDAISNAEFDPLEMDQYNELHSATHALVERFADTRMFSNIIEEQVALLSSMQSRQQLLSRDLQHLVISTRMSEVGELESRLQRNIRTTGKMTGKDVNLHMTGQDTLIDSDLIGKLADPLLHLLRNAVDHGIETADERLAKGKDTVGNIYLDFFRQGQQVVLRCQDDGQGLDLQAIRRQAIAHHLINEQDNLSDHELANLIFNSGFSSRASVSEISGRGVGLDVVRDWASQINGTVTVDVGDYGGCLFELRFSASLSTIQSLIVSTDDGAYFAIPAVQVEQAITHNVGTFEYINDKLNYFYDDEYVTAYFLSELVGLPIDGDKSLSDYNAVIVSVHGKRYAFAVNKLLDSRELLVKPPGRFAQHLQGVSGLSILGNGAIAVNLDLSQLIDAVSQNTTLKRTSIQRQNVKQKPKILIVDDSLTVRDALQQFVEDVGFDACTAKDGFEAVNLLNEITPTVILTDMEMPNMNGIELSKYIRFNDDIKHLPIIMITSRSQEKHKELAKEAGVDEYITKPYSDETLLATINRYL